MTRPAVYDASLAGGAFEEGQMGLSDAILPEFDHEMAGTRKTLERVPEGRNDFRPHAKSMTLGRLAGHLAELPWWASVTLTQSGFDVNPPGGTRRQGQVMTSRAALLEGFDAQVKTARAAIVATGDADFMKPWTLLNGGQKVFTLPRIAVLRSFVLSHTIHHRAQLGVYLRMNDIPVPSLYGPTADEAM
jgi:uncharacterized damage-inducible protein DinB